MENLQGLNSSSKEHLNPADLRSPEASRSLVRAGLAHGEQDTAIANTYENSLSAFQWQLSQAVLKAQPFVAVTENLSYSTPFEVRTAAETVVDPAGYLVITVSSRGALLENIVNQILARIAVEAGKVHDSTVQRKDARARLQQLIRTPDQRIVIIIDNGDKVPTDTFRSLAQALRHRGSKDSLPPMILVVGTQIDFFATTKGKAIIETLGKDGIRADEEAGLAKQLAKKAEANPDTNTAWQLTRERIGRDPNSTISVSESVEPSKSLVVVDPISTPRVHIALFQRIVELTSKSFSFKQRWQKRQNRISKRKMADWLEQKASANTRKTPTFRASGDSARAAETLKST